MFFFAELNCQDGRGNGGEQRHPVVHGRVSARGSALPAGEHSGQHRQHREARCVNGVRKQLVWAFSAKWKAKFIHRCCRCRCRVAFSWLVAVNWVPMEPPRQLLPQTGGFTRSQHRWDSSTFWRIVNGFGWPTDRNVFLTRSPSSLPLPRLWSPRLWRPRRDYQGELSISH